MPGILVTFVDKEFTMDAQAVKRESERLVREAGGETIDWLPWVNRRGTRSQEEVVQRALIMNAMLNIYFKAPVAIIRGWISSNGLDRGLSAWERSFLSKADVDIVEDEKIYIYWYIESLWALMWAGGITDALPFDKGVPNHMATLVPNLQRGEDSSAFTSKFVLRPEEDLFKMLDLYFRCHWFARSEDTQGRSHPSFPYPIIAHRRRSLEWLFDPKCDWDDVPMST